MMPRLTHRQQHEQEWQPQRIDAFYCFLRLKTKCIYNSEALDGQAQLGTQHGGYAVESIVQSTACSVDFNGLNASADLRCKLSFVSNQKMKAFVTAVL